MADVEINYNGLTIASMTASGTKTLLTEGQYCTDDIEVVYTKPSSYKKLGEHEFTINQTATSATSIGNFYVNVPADLWTSSKLIVITIRDKAGKRNGYFLGEDAFFANPKPANGSTDINILNTSIANMLYRCNSNGEYEVASPSTRYGVYAYDINTSGRVRIYARYNATYSLTINGTFKVEVWALDYPNGTPFVVS